jgi:hypothetical protein
MFGPNPDAAAGQPVNRGIGLAQENIFSGHDLLKTIEHSQIGQGTVGAAAAGGGGQGEGDAFGVQGAHHAHRARYGDNLEPHSAEDAILAPAEFLKLRLRAISQEMAEDILPLAAIENKIHLRFGHVASQGLEKSAPSLAMHGMTVDEDAIHVKNDAT